MGATPDKTKEALSPREFERALLAHRKSAARRMSDADLRTPLKQLVHLRKQNRLSDKDFETLIYMVCAAYIEHAIEVRVGERIDEKFQNMFLSRLSPHKLIDLLQ